MREKRKVILEYGLKVEMFSKSLPAVQPYIMNKAKKLDKKSPLFILHTDLINSISKFMRTGDVSYDLGFFYCFVLGEEYSNICKNEELLQSTIADMTNEKNWDDGNLSFEVSLYFAYTFLNELYKDIGIDIHLVMNDRDPLKALKKLREEII